MQFSKLESKAYDELRKNNVFLFKPRDLSLLLKLSRTRTYNLIKALKRKHAIKKIRNFFVLGERSEFAIATELNWPSYISFWSALSYYGFTDNLPRKIFLATTKYSKEVYKFKYVTFSTKRFFGYTKIGDIIIAEKEKAIVDSLLFPKYSGGIKEVINCFEAALSQLDGNKLVDYAIKMKSKAVLRRLGFILEKFGKKKNLEKIKKLIGKGYELFEPSMKKKNNLNKKWLLDINIENHKD